MTSTAAGSDITIVYETHAITEDNETGVATGWLPGRLSAAGRETAVRLGERRREDGLAAVFVSDLDRAVETVEIALGGSGIPVLKDWRLRECDYGSLNGAERSVVHDTRQAYLDQAYPGGESWAQAVARMGRFLADLPLRWSGARVLVVGHLATRFGLDHFLGGRDLVDLLREEFEWQEGWEYVLRPGALRA